MLGDPAKNDAVLCLHRFYVFIWQAILCPILIGNRILQYFAPCMYVVCTLYLPCMSCPSRRPNSKGALWKYRVFSTFWTRISKNTLTNNLWFFVNCSRHVSKTSRRSVAHNSYDLLISIELPGTCIKHESTKRDRNS